MSSSSVKKIIEEITFLNEKKLPTEITLEANPTSLKKPNNLLKELKEVGVNRLSIGVQSFDDIHLKKLGREHDSKDALKTIENAKNIFGEKVSFDLIFSIPDQTLENWKKQLNLAVSLEPSHLSLYQLTLEKSTKFFRLFEEGKIKLPSEEESADMFEYAIDLLSENNLKQYEISNFSKKGLESIHNLAYWNFQSYLGFF